MNELLPNREWQGHVPPNYAAVFQRRADKLKQIRANPSVLPGFKDYYKTRPVQFINDWCITYDPRKATSTDPNDAPTMPFVLFPKQREFIEFLYALVQEQAPGLIEKSRDVGATWCGVAFSVWLWLFWDGAAVGWGSRKQELVDQLGDPKSIFEKIRQTIDWLPREFLPAGFVKRQHMTRMRLINPENGASIVGEIGDEIGRGGRTLIYFKDESAHYEHPESIEAALSANTNIQVDISSVNGLGNVFHRRREAGEVWEASKTLAHDRANVFIFDWSDNPLKSREWYDQERSRFEREGLAHVFAQEVDRDYSGAVTGVIIPSKYVRACLDAHKKIEGMENGRWRASIDPADEGGDKHAAGAVKGVVLKMADHWGEGDTGQTTRRCVGWFRGLVTAGGSLQIQYDAPGVGAGVKSEANRLRELPDSDPERLPKGMIFVPWNGGGHDGTSVLNPDDPVEPDDPETPTNSEMFANVKAQAWWALRRRCEKTYQVLEQGLYYPPDELFSIDTAALGPAVAAELQKQLSQPVRKQNLVSTKLTVDKKPPGTKSPNLADMTVMVMFPMPMLGYDLASAL